MGDTFEVEKVSNGFTITHKQKTYIARSTVEVGRTIVNLIEGMDYLAIQKP